MPREPRRAGARRGVISEQLRRALLHEGGELAGRPDPVEQIRAINDFYAELDFELEPIADARLEAIGALRQQGWSYDRIAAATELSKARVAQLSRTARVAGRAVPPIEP